MQFSSIITALILGVATTAVSGAAVPAAEALVELDARASAVCGSNSYSSAAVQAAATRACQNWRGRVSPSGYPHVYNNREGLRFAVAGQYVEFPILANGRVFTGGAPGPDRVVINGNSCAIAGVMTHTGARGNSFVLCR